MERSTFAAATTAVLLIAAPTTGAPTLAPPPGTSIPIRVAPKVCDASNTLTLSVEKPATGIAVPAGGASKPLTSFAEAIKVAQSRNACFVTIEAGPGRYDESIEVTFPHLKIKSRGTPNATLHGSITNASGHFLEIETLVIDHASKVAVRQTGGRLVMSGVRVQDTDEVAGDENTGIGLWISGGAHAVVRLGVFERNAQAVRAEGDATRLWMTGAIVNATRANATLRTRMLAAHGQGDFPVGAVFVQHRASAWLSTVTLEDSTIAAIHLNHGARMRLDNVTMRRVPGTGGTSGIGGFGVNVRDGSTVEWTRTSVTDAGVSGMVVQGSSLTANSGFVTKAPVGVSLQDPIIQSTRCLQRAMQYREVGVPVQASSYGVPELERSADPPCAQVANEPVPSWN